LRSDGFEVKAQTKDRIEKFTNHPLTGKFAGRERDNRTRSGRNTAYSLKIQSQKPGPLAEQSHTGAQLPVVLLESSKTHWEA
jgi:hypothetical protein